MGYVIVGAAEPSVQEAQLVRELGTANVGIVVLVLAGDVLIRTLGS